MWSLIEKGLKEEITTEDFPELHKSINQLGKQLREARKTTPVEQEPEELNEEIEEQKRISQEEIDLLKKKVAESKEQ